MASSSAMASLFLFYITAISWLRSVSSSSSSPAICRQDSALFLYDLHFQCAPAIAPNPPLKVDGDFIERELMTGRRKGYTSVFFHASWCSFSHSMHPKFETLSSMFPQVEHLVLEQSSALPSIFSRYGIHSLPSILLVNQTSRVRYHGSKDLVSLVQFYEKTTGFRSVYFMEDLWISSSNEETSVPLWNNFSLKDVAIREPYLMFSILFVFLRVLLFVFPEVLSRFRAFWVFYVPRLNLEIFGETSQIMGRVLHLIDVRRIWTKLRLCKTRNFHNGARNARVWALASVSLGESSSARSSS